MDFNGLLIQCFDQFYLALLSVAFHRSIVAVKYGFMPRLRYKQAMSARGLRGLLKNKNEQLMTGKGVIAQRESLRWLGLW